MKQSTPYKQWIFSSWFLFVLLNFVEFPSTFVSADEGPQIESCPNGGGLPGLPGITGRRGLKGNPGPGQAFNNWKQCVWRSANGGDAVTTIYTCQFTKDLDDSALYVHYSANMRLYGCSGCCMRWYFTFNDAECSPITIDGTVYSENTHYSDLLRHRNIQGYCHSLSAGSINVKVLVGYCPGYGSYDAYTGWNSVSRIIIREVPKSPY